MQNQYVQYYGPMATGNNYTSGLLHTIKLTGLTPGTTYYYQCAPPALRTAARAACALPWLRPLSCRWNTPPNQPVLHCRNCDTQHRGQVATG